MVSLVGRLGLGRDAELPMAFRNDFSCSDSHYSAPTVVAFEDVTPSAISLQNKFVIPSTVYKNSTPQ